MELWNDGIMVKDEKLIIPTSLDLHLRRSGVYGATILCQRQIYGYLDSKESSQL